MKTPNPVTAELKRIAEANNGLLQPEKVVEEARPAGSPLHSRFEWDDTIAGQQYRIWQARQLIRVTVEILAQTGKPTEVFVSLTPDRERESGGYRILTDVLSDAEMRSVMLKDALAELNQIRLKYSHLKELATIWAAIKRRGRRGGSRIGTDG